MKAQITLQELAEKLNGKFWSKNGIERVYLEVGHNTKKMSTKTYVTLVDGNFKVSCYIDCPSQTYNWIKSQQEEVIERVDKMIADALIDTYYYVVNENNHPVNESAKVVSNVGELSVDNGLFTTKTKAEKFITDDDLLNHNVVEISRAEFEKLEDEYCAAVRAEIKEVEVKKEVVYAELSKDNKGKKYKHAKFGIGIVSEENDDLVVLTFPEVGEKRLMKKYVKLEIVE